MKYKPVKKRIEQDNKQVCSFCGKEFMESGYSELARAIMQHKPVCSYECNKAIGQVK